MQTIPPARSSLPGAARRTLFLGDPRSIVTEDALHVAPELIGKPLARPWRRGAAMAVDGLLVTLLTNAPSVLFGFAAALVLFRVTSRPRQGSGFVGRSVRLLFRFGVAVILFSTFVSGWESVESRVNGGAQTSMGLGTSGSGPPRVIEGATGVRLAAELLALRGAPDAESAQQRARLAATHLREQGMEEDDIQETLLGLAESAPDRPWLRPAVEDALREPSTTEAPGTAPSGDSLVAAYAAALAASDHAAEEALRPRVAALVARDTLAALDGTVAELQSERGRLRERISELEAAAQRDGGFRALVRRAAGVLGFGFTWAALYFTATVALWNGRTLGKRLLGIRVIRLNAKPIGWWAAFERFGGYAAGVTTGLLGFLQIVWDDNRQGIHDKIAGTVVVRDRDVRPATPAAAPGRWTAPAGAAPRTP